MADDLTVTREGDMLVNASVYDEPKFEVMA
jgi:hypothetical protein